MIVHVTGAHPALPFLLPMLARHYTVAPLLPESPFTLVAFGAIAQLPAHAERLITDTAPDQPVSVPTLVIGDAAPLPGLSYARLATEHPAELLGLIDGYLRYHERYPTGVITEAARV